MLPLRPPLGAGIAVLAAWGQRPCSSAALFVVRRIAITLSANSLTSFSRVAVMSLSGVDTQVVVLIPVIDLDRITNYVCTGKKRSKKGARKAPLKPVLWVRFI